MDEAFSDQRSGARVILVILEERSICYALKIDFHATNNEAKYEAPITRLKLARELGVKTLQFFCDSQLLVCQVRGDYQAGGSNLLLISARSKSYW